MQDYEQGGLKMINLRAYILALKCTWIRRLVTTEAKYKGIFETSYTKLNDIITRGTEFIKTLKYNKSNHFWNDVLGAGLSYAIYQKQ